MKKALVIRLGAYGDMICITPAIKRLKELGYHIILNTGKRGKEVFEHCPHIDEFMLHDESMPIDKLSKHWEELEKEHINKENGDIVINFTESIECNVSMHPIGPMYIYSKKERLEHCNRNFYDATEKWAKLSDCQKIPELFFTNEETAEAQSYLKPDKFNILWNLSGSGKQKVYPWSDYVIGEVLKNYNNIHFITVGDLKCQLLESLVDNEITNLAGRISMRISMCLTGLVDLVVTPDTAILHASGCYDTPKIGLLGHTNRENVTKYFKNDLSIEAQCACAPCFRLIYDHKIQCPIEPFTRAAWCMAEGLPPEVVYNKIKEVLDGRK